MEKIRALIGILGLDQHEVGAIAVSRMLRDAGILAARKEGKQVYYSVRYAALADSLRQIADGIEACCLVESRAFKKLGV